MDRETITTYNKQAYQYDTETAHFWKKFPQQFTLMKKFIEAVGGGFVLDVGSGPGRDGLILQEAGIQVVCLDASTSMTWITQGKGLPTIKADFLSIPLGNNSLKGVWAYTSLLHIPKAELPDALQDIHRVLEQGGVLGLGMIDGDIEGSRVTAGAVTLPRYFAYYSNEELETYLQHKGFQVLFFEKFQPRSHNYLHFLARKA